MEGVRFKDMGLTLLACHGVSRVKGFELLGTPPKEFPKGPSSPYLWLQVPQKVPKSLNNGHLDP